jgi:hypothetical protein
MGVTATIFPEEDPITKRPMPDRIAAARSGGGKGGQFLSERKKSGSFARMAASGMNRVARAGRWTLAIPFRLHAKRLVECMRQKTL